MDESTMLAVKLVLETTVKANFEEFCKASYPTLPKDHPVRKQIELIWNSATLSVLTSVNIVTGNVEVPDDVAVAFVQGLYDEAHEHCSAHIRTQRNELIDKAFNRFKTQTAGYDD